MTAYRDQEPTPQSNRIMINDVQQDVAEVRELANENRQRVYKLERTDPVWAVYRKFLSIAALSVVLFGALVFRKCNADAAECYRICVSMGATDGIIAHGGNATCLCGGPAGSFDPETADGAPLTRASSWCAETCGSFSVAAINISGGEVSCECR